MKMELNHNSWQHVQHEEDYTDNVILGQTVVCEHGANVHLCMCLCVKGCVCMYDMCVFMLTYYGVCIVWRCACARVL